MCSGCDIEARDNGEGGGGGGGGRGIKEVLKSLLCRYLLSSSNGQHLYIQPPTEISGIPLISPTLGDILNAMPQLTCLDTHGIAVAGPCTLTGA